MIEYDLHSSFDAEKHKNKYVNYLEVVIDENELQCMPYRRIKKKP